MTDEEFDSLEKGDYVRQKDKRFRHHKRLILEKDSGSIMLTKIRRRYKDQESGGPVVYSKSHAMQFMTAHKARCQEIGVKINHELPPLDLEVANKKVTDAVQALTRSTRTIPNDPFLYVFKYCFSNGMNFYTAFAVAESKEAGQEQARQLVRDSYKLQGPIHCQWDYYLGEAIHRGFSTDVCFEPSHRARQNIGA